MFETFDLAIRGACMGLLVLLTIHFATIRPVTRKSLSAIGLTVATADYLLASSILLNQQFPQFAQIAQTVAQISPLLIAWAFLELFYDEFQFKAWHIIPVIAIVPTHFLTGVHPIFGITCALSTIVVYAYLFFVAVHTKSNDLVEARCRFRLWFMSAAAVTGIGMTVLHLWMPPPETPPLVYVFKASALFALTTIFAYWVLGIRNEIWAMPNRKTIANTDGLSPAELALLNRLKLSMDQDVWRQEGLTIRKLAEVLDAPEHRLRKVINQGLGYRNFAAFVNEHRIGAACQLLSNPDKADIPILTVAYDVGYASLGPFNRAFREIVGESPTEFRRRSFKLA